MVNEILNPVIFEPSDMTMIDEVRENLLDIVDKFLVDVDSNSNIQVDPLDIILVGSNASYNYTPYSDIDLHIIINFDLVQGYPDSLIQAYYNAEKTNFNDQYDFTIKGIDVEVYVEDTQTSTNSNGVYSVLYNDWIKKPKRIIEPEIDLQSNEQFIEMNTLVQSALVSGDLCQVKYAIDQLYMMRKYSMLLSDEYDVGNLIFKELRNRGYIDELKSQYNELVSKELSIENINIRD